MRHRLMHVAPKPVVGTAAHTGCAVAHPITAKREVKIQTGQ